MKNQVNTSEGNVQFIDATGKMIDIHPQHVYAVFNVDTVSFVMVGIPKTSGLSILTSTAEDMLFNGEEYTFEELKTVIPEEFAEAGAQARCEIVDELPETGKTNTIYLVPKPSGETGYDEYIYIKETQSWELVGDTSIEMENYLLKTDFYTYSAATEVTITALSGAISDEASRAISAESALSDSIDALNLYIDEVSGITDDLDGRVDILEESLAQEASARTDADTVLSGAISSVTEDVAALSGDVAAHTSNTDIHVTAADKTAWADKYTQAEVDSIVSGLNDSIDAVSGAVADETARAISAETALHNEIENIDLSDYYTKSQTSGATELSTAFAAKQNVLTAGENIVISGDVISAEADNDVTELTQAEYDALVEAGTVDPDVLYIITDAAPINLNNYYQKSETSSKTEIEDAISAEATARANADTALSGAVDTALLGYINDAEYVSSAKTINFLNGNTLIAQIDATDFIKDGMVDTVAISGGNLVITFNTDSGKEAIELPLTQIFDPSNYYTKSEVDAEISAATANINYIKAHATKIDGDSFWPSSSPKLIGFSLISLDGSTTSSCVEAFVGDGLIKTDTRYLKVNFTNELTSASTTTQVPSAKAVNDSLALKLDSTAYTPTDLSNYYTKGETSGATEIATALSAKLDATAYTPTDLSNYYQKSETSGATELSTAFAAKADATTTYTKSEVDTSLANKADTSAVTAVQDSLSGYTTTGDTNALSGAVTAHTSDSDIHVTTGDKATWNAKLDSSAIADMATQTWVGQQGYLTQHQDISGKQDVSGMTAYTTTATTNALSGTVTGHTADTTVHVTSADKTAWNGAVTASSANTTALGGLKLVKISQSDYDGLTTKDSNTLYVIND